LLVMAVIRSEIVFIGPRAAGKSTLAALLGERLALPVVALDRVKWDYFRALGCDEAEAGRIREAQGFWAMTRWLQPYAIAMVERVLEDHRDCIFDFGAGHTMYDDPAFVSRIHAALTPFRNVVLVLPSPAEDESIRVLTERVGPFTIPPHWVFVDIPAYEVRQPSNRTLASLTVYTHGRTPEQTCDDLLRQLAERIATRSRTGTERTPSRTSRSLR
jgi:hypothetical protein